MRSQNFDQWWNGLSSISSIKIPNIVDISVNIDIQTEDKYQIVDFDIKTKPTTLTSSEVTEALCSHGIASLESQIQGNITAHDLSDFNVENLFIIYHKTENENCESSMAQKMHFNAICSSKQLGTNTTCELNWIQENRKLKVIGITKYSDMFTVTIEKIVTRIFKVEDELVITLPTYEKINSFRESLVSHFVPIMEFTAALTSKATINGSVIEIPMVLMWTDKVVEKLKQSNLLTNLIDFRPLIKSSGFNYQLGNKSFLESSEQVTLKLTEEIMEILDQLARLVKTVRVWFRNASETDNQERIKAALQGRQFHAQ